MQVIIVGSIILFLLFSIYIKFGLFGLVGGGAMFLVFGVIIPLVAKRDLRKIQIERANLNNQEILDALEKDLKEKRKK
jgi:cell division septal protein FtsQ